MKSWWRFCNLNRRFALAANCLDKVGRVFRNSPDMKRNIPLLLITFSIVCFGLLQKARAVVPPPDGGYPNFTTAEGTKALQSLTTGSANTAVGWYSLFSTGAASNNTGVGAGALALNTADNNTAVGLAAMFLNASGHDNVANGTAALVYNGSGNYNDAVGAFALFKNVTGSGNNAFGNSALALNINAHDNTAIGDSALESNDMTGNGTANYNTAVGAGALLLNTDGGSNTAVGDTALFSNDTGDVNTAVGTETLYSNTDGFGNTAVGHDALFSNDIGFENTAVGRVALASNLSGHLNTAVGNEALSSLTTGNSNIALGDAAGSNHTTGSSNIDIGNLGVDLESNTIRIGDSATHTDTYIAGISGATVTGTAVVVDGSGKLGVAPSSARFKEAIKSMDNASEALFSLRPVTFRYKKEIDPKSTAQFGLVAEDVEKVNADLVVRDAEGKVYSVRYDQVNAMLLNEFLKEHRIVQEQGVTITRQRKDFEAAIAQQQKQIEALTEGLQKVNAQPEASKAAPQTVKNTD